MRTSKPTSIRCFVSDGKTLFLEWVFQQKAWNSTQSTFGSRPRSKRAPVARTAQNLNLKSRANKQAHLNPLLHQRCSAKRHGIPHNPRLDPGPDPNVHQSQASPPQSVGSTLSAMEKRFFLSGCATKRRGIPHADRFAQSGLPQKFCAFWQCAHSRKSVFFNQTAHDMLPSWWMWKSEFIFSRN